MPDRIPTPAPDSTTIEEALLRVRVEANIVETIARPCAARGERHANPSN